KARAACTQGRRKTRRAVETLSHGGKLVLMARRRAGAPLEGIAREESLLCWLLAGESLEPLSLALLQLFFGQILFVGCYRPAVAMGIDKRADAIAPELFAHLKHHF